MNVDFFISSVDTSNFWRQPLKSFAVDFVYRCQQLTVQVATIT